MQSKEVQLLYNGQPNKIPIKQFVLNELCDHASIVMIAKRGRGKSWVVRAILYHYARKIPVGLIIAPTDRMTGFYKSFIPDSYIYYKFNSDIINRILIRQKNIIVKNDERITKGYSEINTSAFIVMDDCLADKGKWAKDATISELLFNGRHYHIMYILTMQFSLGIMPELRGNFDYVFLLADDTFSNQKRIFDHYAGIFPNFEAFRQIFRQLTDNYGCMVINNRGIRNNFFDKIYYYKAPNLENVHINIGCDQFQKFHENNYNKKWVLRNSIFNDTCDRFDKNKIMGKKIIVKKIKNEVEEYGKDNRQRRY